MRVTYDLYMDEEKSGELVAWVEGMARERYPVSGRVIKQEVTVLAVIQKDDGLFETAPIWPLKVIGPKSLEKSSGALQELEIALIDWMQEVSDTPAKYHDDDTPWMGKHEPEQLYRKARAYFKEKGE